MRTVTSEIVQANRTTQTTGEFKQQLSPWWRRILRQTRSRILLLLALTMLVIAGVSLPLFLWLFLAEVDRRVQDDLVEEMEQFTLACLHLFLASPNLYIKVSLSFHSETLKKR